MTVLAVVLAAGGGTRFAGATHKLLAPLRGRPVLAHALEHVAAAGFDDLVVVTGAADLREVELPATARLVHNPRWAEGQATSLQAAVAEAVRCGHDTLVIGLGDQPFVPAAAWQAVAAAPGPLAVAVLEGQRTPPVKIAAELWSQLPTSGDAGARVLLQRLPDLVVPVACPGSPVDIDTAEDLAEWN